jgi:hypothetical protein
MRWTTCFGLATSSSFRWLNHKTNVGLNSLPEKAIPDAINKVQYFTRPIAYDDFITFIDDYVIGTIFHVATHTKGAHPYTKLLVDRRVPRHLGAVRLEADESREQRDARRRVWFRQGPLRAHPPRFGRTRRQPSHSMM